MRINIAIILVFYAPLAFSKSPTMKMSIIEVFEKALFEKTNNTDPIMFIDAEITLEGLDFMNIDLNQFLLEKYKDDDRIKLDSGRIVIPNGLMFINCVLPSELMPGIISNFSFKELVFDTAPRYMVIKNCHFLYLNIRTKSQADIEILSSSFKRLDVDISGKEGISSIYFADSKTNRFLIKAGEGEVSILNSTLHTPPPVDNKSCYSKEDSLRSVYGTLFIDKSSGTLDIEGDKTNVLLTNTKFLNKELLGFVSMNGSFGSVEIKNCNFENSVILEGSVNDFLTLRNNKFSGGISLADFQFPETKNSFNWSEFQDDKLFRAIAFNDSLHKCPRAFKGFYTLNKVYFNIFRGVTPYELNDRFSYDDHISTYQKLYNIFRSRGDIESANLCYIEMKDIQTGRLKYLYIQHPSFNSYFRWKLAQLVKLYSNHGTDPAQAIIVSVWVITCFAIFYFFFPSDWDVTSKSRLIQDYKDFIEKNEKGYFKPFIILLFGFIFSLVNAITLSINSFTTLGFGNIPTHGVAKYFCVLEGFIGWFLLSIFTVALINQVLA